ncbi:MAG: hypothetical protein ACREH8_03530 [Opitutaceae bacterium]
MAALLMLGGGLFFAWKHFAPAGSKPAPAPAPMSAPAQKAPVVVTSTSPLTPSDTLNQLAHAPAQAINKAQDAIAARRASGQSRIDAASVGEDLPDQPAAPARTPAQNPVTSTARPAPHAVTSTTIAPGVAATAAQVEAAPEAAAPFRSFVANAKVSGVFQGPPTRVMINGRLVRAGEVVEATLGITFNGVDSSRRQLLFVDRTGATVTRRF